MAFKPKNNKLDGRNLQVRLSHSQIHRLEDIRKNTGIAIADLVRQCIDYALEDMAVP